MEWLTEYICCLSIKAVVCNLVVQWLRIHLPVKGTQVQCLLGELRAPMPGGQTNTHAAMKTQSSQKKNHQKQSAKGHIQNDTFAQERRGNKII